MQEFDHVRLGDTWTFYFVRSSVRITLTVLAEDRYGVHAEAVFRRNCLGLEEYSPAWNGEHLLRTRLNLIYEKDKHGLLLNLLRKSGDVPIPWGEIIEIICEIVIYDYRSGSPVVVLGQNPILPKEQELVYHFLPQNEPTVLFANGGSGKSTFALALAFAVANRTALPHLTPLDQGPVLYLDWESTQAEQELRLHQIAHGLGKEIGNQIFYRNLFRPLVDEIQAIREVVAENAIALLILDSLVPAVGGEAEKAAEVTHFFNALRSLPTCTKLILAHVAKAAVEAQSASPYGSIFVRNLGRSVWELRTSQEGLENQLVAGFFHRKVNQGPLRPPFGLALTFADDQIQITSYDLAADSELASYAGPAFRIRNQLKRGNLPANQLAENLGLELKVVLATLKRMNDVIRLEGPSKITTWGLKDLRQGRL